MSSLKLDFQNVPRNFSAPGIFRIPLTVCICYREIKIPTGITCKKIFYKSALNMAYF